MERVSRGEVCMCVCEEGVNKGKNLGRKVGSCGRGKVKCRRGWGIDKINNRKERKKERKRRRTGVQSTYLMLHGLLSSSLAVHTP